jgi:hypothetical protein
MCQLLSILLARKATPQLSLTMALFCCLVYTFGYIGNSLYWLNSRYYNFHIRSPISRLHNGHTLRPMLIDKNCHVWKPISGHYNCLHRQRGVTFWDSERNQLLFTNRCARDGSPPKSLPSSLDYAAR